MAKKQNTLPAEATANVRTVRTFEFDQADADAAQQLGIALAGNLEDRITRAVHAYNMAARLAVEAGYLLLSVKAELPHGEFETGVETMGLTRQRAAELMRMAKFASSLPAAQRADLLTLPKTKVLALASADPEVIEELLDSGADEIDALSVRDLRQKLRDMQAALTDTAVQRDTAEAELETAKKKLAKGQPEREDAVPLVVADLRAEVAALGKKAELAIGSFGPLGADIVNLLGTEASEWADATLRLAVASLGALRLQIDGLLKSYLKELPGEDPSPAERTYMTRQEVVETAKRYGELVALHDHEKALREWEREQQRPRGKGRPSKAPEAPKGSK